MYIILEPFTLSITKQRWVTVVFILWTCAWILSMARWQRLTTSRSGALVKNTKQNKLLADSHKTNNLLFPSKHLLCSARDKMEVLAALHRI